MDYNRSDVGARITNPRQLLWVLCGYKKAPQFPEGLLIKVGDDLLSHNCSTIGAVGLNFSVRNGKRWNPDAIVT